MSYFYTIHLFVYLFILAHWVWLVPSMCTYMSMSPSTEVRSYHILKRKWLSLSQHPSSANSSSARAGTWGLGSPSPVNDGILIDLVQETAFSSTCPYLQALTFFLPLFQWAIGRAYAFKESIVEYRWNDNILSKYSGKEVQAGHGVTRMGKWGARWRLSKWSVHAETTWEPVILQCKFWNIIRGG